jgi:3-oxoacyl-[acyl-carrier protein] reductase
MLLEGKNAVITGCLRGIGKAALEAYARNGANVWACCQVQDDEFEAYAKSLAEETKVWITPVYFDLSDTEQIKASMKEIIKCKQKVDVLVNVAGMTYNALFQMMTMDKMKEVFEIDFFSQMIISQYIAKVMIRQKSGSIINIASIAGLDGNYGQLAYSAAKAALIGATKTLSLELAEHNIRVNAIAPGVIRTEMTAALPKDKFDVLVSKSKLGRPGETKEVSDVLVFLGSELSSYMTGQVIRVDGGMK